MPTAVRVHWRLGCVVIVLAASLMLAGLALARQLGLEQTRRVAVACVQSSLTSGRAAPDAPLGIAAGSATSETATALAQPAAPARPRLKKSPCGSGKPGRLRGVSRRIALERDRSSAAPASGAGRTEVAPAQPATAAPSAVKSTPPGPETKPPALDTTPPETSITSGPPATSAATTVGFAFSSSESGSTFECKLDGGAWKACISPKGYSSVLPGPHQFSARATDSALNTDQTPAVWSWTAQSAPATDTIPPQTAITSGPAGTTTATTAAFTLSSNEAGSSFECKLDDGTWTVCGNRTTYTDLDVGSHQFAARAIDPANNVDTSPAMRNWAVEEPPEPPPSTPPAECSSVVTSAGAAQSAVSAAAGGAVICLADGSYGELTISASKSSEVTLQAEHPGKATIAGASLSGSHLTLARFNITNEVTIAPGSSSMTVEYNRITGGYMGINAGPTTSTSISDTTIRGNKLVGPFGEDALRINRYHDSGDADPYGILIEGNEITGVRENGNHSDCLQSVWGGDGLYFRRNYLHDNRCQGFFVKDQPSTIVGIVVENNLFLRNSEPCAPEAPGCGQPSYLQVFGPYQNFTMRRNTVWQGEVVAAFQSGTGPGTAIEENVVNRFWTSTDLSPIVYANNTRCRREATGGGSWPAQAPGETVDCAPPFANPATDDYRLPGVDRGVDWAPAEQHYGP